MVIGFAGKIGTGKSTISLSLAKRLNYSQVSFSGYLKALAEKKGIPLERKQLQDLGQSLIENNIHEFCQSVLKSTGWTNGKGLIIDGIRHQEVIPVIRNLVKPDTFKIVLLKVSDEQVRAHRNNLNLDQLNTSEEHPAEFQVKNNLIDDAADLILDGTESVEELTSILVAWWQEVSQNNPEY